MNFTIVIVSFAIVGIVGLICGMGLGVASEKFKVEVDEKELAVREALPGNNCGACGFPGCDGCAHAIASGSAPVTQCPVGGKPVAQKIADIMGVQAGEAAKKVAMVRCSGTCDKAIKRAKNVGPTDCNQMSVMPGGGDLGCDFGCLGGGSCVKACEFDAIHVVDGIAVVDKDKCVACGLCVKACPRHIIEMTTYKAKYHVRCMSQEKGKAVKDVCQAGCIGCTLCTKECKFDAIHMNGNVAQIDYDKCVNCGACARKCRPHSRARTSSRKSMCRIRL